MRTETKVFTYYKFEELSEDAQKKAIENLSDINIHHDWYESVYEDAKTIGCTITEFDIDRGSNCSIRFKNNGHDVILAILKNHGDTCDTYKLALEYKDKILDAEGFVNEDVEHDFRKELESEYLSMLRKEYEYLTSEECIKETILANEYEFTIDGKLA